MSSEAASRRRGRRARRDRGFTLLETLVALTLLAMVTAAAYQAVGAGARATVSGQAALAALAAAENALAAARIDPSLDVGTRRAVADGAAVTVVVAPGPAPLLRQVTVEARTPDGGAARLATLVAAPPR